MDIQNWKIFDKKGSPINWFVDSYLNIDFETDAQNAIGADGYCLTDPSGQIKETIITNSGWNYDSNNTAAVLNYVFDPSFFGYQLSSVEASIAYLDVSVFDPEPRSTLGIGGVDIDLSTAFIYPSAAFVGSIFLKPVAVGLIETEHLTILQETSTGGFIRPYDPSSQLVFSFINDDDKDIKMFIIDEDNQIIEWADQLSFETATLINLPLTINIGFKSTEEGVFERTLRIYERTTESDLLIGEIAISAQSIGQDERFDTLLQDLAPVLNAKNIPHLFKESNINEELPDWELINYKSKHAVIDYNQITPYIGSYKALVNAIKWLGYEDIQIKEWFRDVKEGNKLGLYVPYDAKERAKTILYFTPEERRNLKKLNELSLIYCINRDTGEIDEWGNPITENCYEYNLNEILIKLFALKEWLEVNIIGVHARVVDLTGEGIYYERFRNIIYGTQDIGTRAEYVHSLTPTTLGNNSELIAGDSSIDLSLLEYSHTKISDFENFRFRDLIDYGYSQDPSLYDPCTGTYSTISNDSSILDNFDASLVRVGPTFRNPFWNLYDIQWRATVEKSISGVLTDQFITNPLWIYDNDIRYYDIFKDEARFYDISTNLDIILEEAILRDASNDNWINSEAYSIYKDPSGYYVMESSMGAITKFNGFAIYHPSDSSALLQYNVDDNYMAPLLSFENYEYTDSSGVTQILDPGKKYFLDIQDGKIAMDASILTTDNEVITTTQYINFNFDTSLLEQKITLNVVYNSPRMTMFQYDPSVYYNLTVNNYQDPSASLIIDNSVYRMNVNHIGDYFLEIFAWDGQNVLYNNIYKEGDGTYDVWTKYPTILSYLDNSVNSGWNYDSSWNIMTALDASNLYGENEDPIFDRLVPLQGLTLEKDVNGKYYIKVPSITFFQDLPDPGTIAKFYNLTERCVSVNSSTEIVIDPDFQTFYQDDSINIVLFNKGTYDIIEQEENTISGIAGNTITLNSAMPSNFIIDNSTQLYLQNDSLRSISNIINDTVNETVNLDVSNYIFLPNQLVGIIIDDISTGNSWGSSFRVIDTSGNNHTLEGNVPSFAIDPSLYAINAKHSFSTFSSFEIGVNSAQEIGNNFHIYLDDIYYHQYYLDNTFVFMNILFDQEKVLEQWYDPSDGAFSDYYYPFDTAINIDVSTLVILRGVYDPSTYMLNQKNVWSIKNHDNGSFLMRVFNDSILYNFDVEGKYDIKCESYDSFGNLRAQLFEGLITVQ